MKYKDYYAALEVDRNASEADIKKAYRRLARKYHPDVSKEKDAEEKFKVIAEAYQTLSDKEKRAAYDQLGRHNPGEDFRPPPGWETQFSRGGMGDGIDLGGLDLGDLFEALGRGRGHARGRRAGGPQGFAGEGETFSMPGQDFEATTQLSLEDAFRGAEISLDLSIPDIGPDGSLRRAQRSVRVRIPKGATDGQRLRVPGKGGSGFNGGPSGDLYLNIRIAAHPRFRLSGHDLYLDLPVTPAEAVLGATIQVPTMEGRVALNIRPGTRSGHKLRVAGKGLPRPHGTAGDLYCVINIVTPAAPSDKERALYTELAAAAHDDPRAHLA